MFVPPPSSCCDKVNDATTGTSSVGRWTWYLKCRPSSLCGLCFLGVVDGLAEDVDGGADFGDEVVGPFGGVVDGPPGCGVVALDGLVDVEGPGRLLDCSLDAGPASAGRVKFPAGDPASPLVGEVERRPKRFLVVPLSG
jgi:hypothetical protein